MTEVNGYGIVPAADLREADLRGADLRGADLRCADLGGANLGGADLRDADLMGAKLRGADLRGAYLGGANLRDAYLRDAYLRGADLWGANLWGAYLGGANLRDAYLVGARLPHFQIPQEGPLVVWKKLSRGRLAKLFIPNEAKRTASLVGRKCRAEYAFVDELYTDSGRKSKAKRPVESYRGGSYKVGETVRPDSYDPDPRVECSHGIHFFLTREEAEEWL